VRVRHDPNAGRKPDPQCIRTGFLRPSRDDRYLHPWDRRIRHPRDAGGQLGEGTRSRGASAAG
jgi:hypothetical protein